MADASVLKSFITPGKEKQAESIANKGGNSIYGGGSSSSKAKNSLGISDTVTSDNIGQTLGALSQFFTPGTNVSGIQKSLSESLSSGKPLDVNTLKQYAGTPIIPNKPESPFKLSEITSGNMGLGLNADGTSNNLVTPQTTETTDGNSNAALDLFKAYSTAKDDLQAKMPNQYDEYLKAEKNSGLQQARQEENNLNAQITTITNRALADEAQLRSTGAREGVTEAVYGQQYNEIARRAAIEALPLQSQLAYVQGNIKLAEERLNTLFALKMKDAQNQFDYTNKKLDLAYQFASDQQKAKLDEIKQKSQNEFTLKRDNIAFKHDAMAQAQKDGNMALFSALSTINEDDSNFESQFANAINNNLGKGDLSGLTEEQKSDPFIVKMLATKGGKSLTDTPLIKIEKGLTVLGQLGVLQNNVQDVSTGPIVGAFKGANPWDTNAQTIKAQLNAIVPNLARGVYGEVGVLTDNDIKTYSATLPNLTSTQDVRNAVLGITIDLIGKSIKNTLEVQAAGGRDVSRFVDLYTEMEKTKNSIFSQIPGYKGNVATTITPEDSSVFDSVIGTSNNSSEPTSNKSSLNDVSTEQWINAVKPPTFNLSSWLK